MAFRLGISSASDQMGRRRRGPRRAEGPGERPWTERGQLVAVRMGKGTGWAARLPHRGRRHARPLKSGLGSGRGNSPLLSQKVANPPASARRDGQRGASGLRRLLSRSLNAKKPARGVRRAHSPILHLCPYSTVGRRKCQAPSGFETRLAADESAPQKPWFWRQTSGMSGCLGAGVRAFPHDFMGTP
jgi:hypothetical protein